MTEQLTATEKKLAETLFSSYTTHQPLQMADYQEMVSTDESAYRVQSYLTELKQDTVGGYKVSLTSPETQAMFDSDSPLYGAQISSHFLPAPANFKADQLMEPLAEVELLFTVQRDLSDSDTPAELLQKTLVAPAIEVPDARFSDWFPALPKHLVMADAAVGGYVVYGQERPAAEIFATPEDVAQVHCQLFHDDQYLKAGAATEVLGNPLKSLHWLTEKLAEQGKSLVAGQRVSSGTFLLPENLTAGKWAAKFGCGLGEVSLTVGE